jgi:predicted DNA-binding protein YlxM (UPF0122 family)
MADFFRTALGIFSSSLSSEPELHPRVTFPIHITDELRQRELYSECDDQFKHLEPYRRAMSGKGVYKRVRLPEEPVQEGKLLAIVKDQLDAKYKLVNSRAIRLYHINVDPIYQVFISDGISVISFFSRGINFIKGLHRNHVGPFQIEQGDFIARLEGRDYLGALRQSHRLVEVGLDRLRGQVERIETILVAPMLTPEDRKTIRLTMMRFHESWEKELGYWWERANGLRVFYDLMHHLIDDARLVIYQYKTKPKGKVDTFSTNFNLWTLDSLFKELEAAYHEESRVQRLNLGIFTRVEEYVLNRGYVPASKFDGAEEPGQFLEVVNRANERLKKDYASIEAYKESTPLSDEDRGNAFLSAVSHGRFFMAKQLALNGFLAGSIIGEDQVLRLELYKELDTAFSDIIDAFHIHKHLIAHQLKNGKNDELTKLFDILDESSQLAYMERVQLKRALEEEIKNTITGQSSYLDQFKTAAVEGVKNYLFKGSIFVKTLSYEVVERGMRNNIDRYLRYIYEAKELLGSGERAATLSAAVASSSSSSQEMENQGKEKGSSLPGPALGSSLSPTIPLEAISRQSISKFSTPREYCDFVNSKEFENDGRVERAIWNCEANLLVPPVRWAWALEKDELTQYRAMQRAISEKKGCSRKYIAELHEDLLESFRRKVVSDYSAYVSKLSPSWLELKGYQNSLVQLYRSSHRKLERLWEEGTVFNSAENFRDEKFKIKFLARMKWQEDATPLTPGPSAELSAPLLVTIPDASHPVQETVKTQTKAIFTPDDYYNYVTSADFVKEPHIAFEYINNHASLEKAAIWSWDEKRLDLQKLIQGLGNVNARQELSAEDRERLIRDWFEAHGAQVVKDHSKYMASLSGYSAALPTRIFQSAIRKTGRMLYLQSPINRAKDFRDPTFLSLYGIVGDPSLISLEDSTASGGSSTSPITSQPSSPLLERSGTASSLGGSALSDSGYLQQSSSPQPSELGASAPSGWGIGSFKRLLPSMPSFPNPFRGSVPQQDSPQHQKHE